MLLPNHCGRKPAPTADHFDPDETKKWKRDVLEAYLGVTLKRLFSTGPEAFEEIYKRLEQFTQALSAGPADMPEAGGNSLAATHRNSEGTPYSPYVPLAL